MYTLIKLLKTNDIDKSIFLKKANKKKDMILAEKQRKD